MASNLNFDFDLIKLVKKRRCLYENMSRKNENNKERVAEWKRIAAALGKPVLECKQRWRSLRDRFVRERRKMERGQMQPGYANVWEYYDDMKFVIPTVRQRKNKRIFRGSDSNRAIKQELPLDIDNTSNSIDEEEEQGAASFVSENLSSDSFDVEPTRVQQNHPTASHASSNRDDESVGHISVDDDCFELEEQMAVDTKPFQIDDKNCCKLINSTSEYQSDISNSIETSQSTAARQSEHVTTTTARGMGSKAPLNDFMNVVKTEMRKVFDEEKDENDIFLEFMGRQMKKLSGVAKLKIQAEFMQRVTEELIKEFQE